MQFIRQISQKPYQREHLEKVWSIGQKSDIKEFKSGALELEAQGIMPFARIENSEATENHSLVRYVVAAPDSVDLFQQKLVALKEVYNEEFNLNFTLDEQFNNNLCTELFFYERPQRAMVVFKFFQENNPNKQWEWLRQKDVNGRTILHVMFAFKALYSSTEDKFEIIKSLKRLMSGMPENGKDVLNITDNSGLTPLDYARIFGDRYTLSPSAFRDFLPKHDYQKYNTEEEICELIETFAIVPNRPHWAFRNHLTSDPKNSDAMELGYIEYTSSSDGIQEEFIPCTYAEFKQRFLTDNLAESLKENFYTPDGVKLDSWDPENLQELASYLQELFKDFDPAKESLISHVMEARQLNLDHSEMPQRTL